MPGIKIKNSIRNGRKKPMNFWSSFSALSTKLPVNVPPSLEVLRRFEPLIIDPLIVLFPMNELDMIP